MEKSRHKNYFVLLLMSSSLLFLGIFLMAWLTNVYHQEVARLKEKSSFVFINSIREAETDFIKQELLPSLMNINSKERNAIKMATFKVAMADENGTSKATYEMMDSAGINVEAQVSINLESEIVSGPTQGSGGALISWLTKGKDIDSTVSLSVHYEDSLLLKAIEKIVTNSPKFEGLPNQYKIVKINDSINHFSSIISDPYKDYDSGETFALAFEKADSYLLAKILPQIGFSIFLFTITALSFWFTYKNLRNQQRLTEVKNELISNITHELKTPIATVRVAIEALQNFGALEDPNRSKEYLNISQQELNRLTILVEKVLNASLFEKTEVPLKKETINFKQLIQAVLYSMKLQFQDKKAVINFKTTGEDFKINGDKIHLTSVVYNLIDNALKYSPLAPVLTINLEESSKQLNFNIKDNGLGIPLEFQDKIFDKFFRVPSGDAHNIKGHGLGLNYVKKVIEKHGGEISFNSEQGKGTQFLVSLPINS